MGLKVEYRKFIRCDAEADLDSQYGEEALYYAVAENTYWQYSIAEAAFLPLDPKEIHITASELITMLEGQISGTQTGSKFLRDDWTWDTPEGGTGGGGSPTTSDVLIDCGSFTAPNENLLIDCGAF